MEAWAHSVKAEANIEVQLSVAVELEVGVCIGSGKESEEIKQNESSQSTKIAQGRKVTKKSTSREAIYHVDERKQSSSERRDDQSIWAGADD